MTSAPQSSFLTGLEGLFETAWTDLRSAGATLITEGEQIASEAFDQISQLIAIGAPLAIKAVLAQWGLSIPGSDKFSQAVTDLIQGLEAQGISWAQSMLARVHALVQNAFDWVLSKLGVAQAPSTQAAG